MKVIGVTGSFGTGKTTVASMFKAKGAIVIDADRIARALTRKGTPEYKKIKSIFGVEILKRGGEIDRKKLAAIVFDKKEYLKKLNNIVHPGIIRKIRENIGKAGRDKIVVIDAPLLVEAGLSGIADFLVVVKCPVREQIKRCVTKRRMNKKDVLKRIGSQIPMKKKVAIADFVIDNEVAKSYTKKQVEKVWRKVWR